MARMFTIVACVCISHGKALLLRRVPHKSQGGKWGLPAGKPEPAESYADAMLRELQEETGLTVKPAELVKQGSFAFNKQLSGEYKIILYSLGLKDIPPITLTANEHSGYQWLALEQCLQMTDLVADTDTLLRTG